MILITSLSIISFILIVFISPILVIGALVPLYIGLPLSVIWIICALIWFYFSSAWLLQAYHSKLLATGNRINSYICLENFLDAKSKYALPQIYVQKFSHVNPLLIIVDGGKFIYLFSSSYYELLSDDNFTNLLSLASKKRMLVPFWIAGKLLSLKVLFLQFYSSLNRDIERINIKPIRITAQYASTLLRYITSPYFLLSGWLYTKTWMLFIHKSFENGELSREAWERLEQTLKDENQMSIIGYFLGTGHAEVRAHSLVSV